MPPSATQTQGARAEERAAQYLESQGLSLIGRNLRCRCGELDLVARQADMLIVIEVRERANRRFGGAAYSIGWLKQRRILCATRYFLQREPAWARLRVRFDAVLLDDGGTVEWVRHAFDAS